MNSLSWEDNEALGSRNRERQMQPSAEAELLPVVERKYSCNTGTEKILYEILCTTQSCQHLRNRNTGGKSGK